MKAIITRYSIDTKVTDKDDEFTFIHAFFCTEAYPEASMPVIFSFDDLVNFIAEKDEATGNYLKRLRCNIRGFGAGQKPLSDVVLEEDFDLEPYIFQFQENYEAEYILQHLEEGKILNLLKAEMISAHAAAPYANDNSKHNCIVNLNKFQSELNQALHAITLKYFPDLLEMDKKYIAAYRDNLADLTLSFSEKVAKIICGKFDSYWEDQATKQR
jgi:hypothetical protein